MKYIFTDYNESTTLFSGKYETEWKEIERVLKNIPLFIKDSDQRGKQGSKIFNPVGTNKAIEDGLVKFHWKSKMPIPESFSFLGTDIDFIKKGILVEAQFSNYPFLLNNIQRSELFLKSSTVFDKVPTETLVVITKCHLLPASNSTLYYEQAKNQLDALSHYRVFSIPVRLIGLTENTDTPIKVKNVLYDSARYSRTENEVREHDAIITQKNGGRGIISIT
jgi:hypothetical protein